MECHLSHPALSFAACEHCSSNGKSYISKCLAVVSGFPIAFLFRAMSLAVLLCQGDIEVRGGSDRLPPQADEYSCIPNLGAGSQPVFTPMLPLLSNHTQSHASTAIPPHAPPPSPHLPLTQVSTLLLVFYRYPFSYSDRQPFFCISRNGRSGLS